ncbi:hypothetical protein CAPTEDRAFT_185725, partial [Capitella teleta]
MPVNVIHPRVPQDTKQKKMHEFNGGRQANLSEYRFITSTIKLESTVRFIQGAFSEQTDRVHPTIEVCAFHTALAFNAQFVQDVIKRLDAKEAQFIATASVVKKVRSKQHFSWDCGEESFHNLEEKVFTKNYIKQGAELFFEIPLGFVAFGGNFELLPLLYQCGVNVDHVDTEGNNIAHCIVDISEWNAERATAMYEAIIYKEDVETRKRLLLHLNHNGMTPLDIASNRHLPEMTHLILNTIGVFKFPLREHALDVHMLYDITGKESVLHEISLATEKELKRFDEFRLFEREPIKSWINETINSSHKAVLYWMVIWLASMSFYIICVSLVE